MALKNITLTNDNSSYNANNSYVVATNGHQHVTYNGTNDAFSHSVTRTSASAQSYTVNGLDYRTLIHRGYTQIVIAQWKGVGTSFLDGVSSTSYTVANGIPASRPNRKNTDYVASFTVQLGDNSSDKNTSRGPSAKAPHSNAQCGNENRTLSLNSPSSIISPKVKVNVYLGSGNVVHDTSCPSSDYSKTTGNASGSTIISGHATKSGSLTNFRPYVQMKYDTLYSYDNKAYVLGEIDRSLTFNSYAELEWTKFNNPNLTINSLQWSTHNEANQHHLSGTVLPGGATLSLSVSNTNAQIVKVRTFQPILAGDGLTQVNSAGGTASFADINAITQSHAEYAETVRTNLDNVHIQQYASTTDYGLDVMNTARANKTDVIDSEDNKVKNGVPTADGIGGSNEDKYYFKKDTANGINGSSAEGDLDATITGTSVYYVTFWCDSAGNIRVNKSNTLAGASNISGLVADESDISTDSNIVARRIIGETGMCWVNGTYTSLAKEFDEKTKVVTKLFLGLEKGGGLDFSAPWTSDGGWYNEAFDGITYVVYTSDIKVTFATPSERITVLDPKLCPESTSKGNLFSDFHTSQFKLEKNATDQTNQVVGTYRDPKTGDTTNIKMPGLDMLYWSREFYVPNVTTQDLN